MGFCRKLDSLFRFNAANTLLNVKYTYVETLQSSFSVLSLSFPSFCCFHSRAHPSTEKFVHRKKNTCLKKKRYENFARLQNSKHKSFRAWKTWAPTVTNTKFNAITNKPE